MALSSNTTIQHYILKQPPACPRATGNCQTGTGPDPSLGVKRIQKASKGQKWHGTKGTKRRRTKRSFHVFSFKGHPNLVLSVFGQPCFACNIALSQPTLKVHCEVQCFLNGFGFTTRLRFFSLRSLSGSSFLARHHHISIRRASWKLTRKGFIQVMHQRKKVHQF